MHHLMPSENLQSLMNLIFLQIRSEVMVKLFRVGSKGKVLNQVFEDYSFTVAFHYLSFVPRRDADENVKIYIAIFVIINPKKLNPSMTQF